ncbi:MAG TPA: TRAP transporter small permease subunit [Beijerinckiaceae bacterium]|nr:TRAP transporter small permease subunit [Beijerinckiaceae bacterium]
MKALDDLLKAIGTFVPVVLLAVVLAIVPASVIARNLFDAEVYAAHDIAMLAFAGVVWFGLVGAAIDGQLFGVNFFVDKLPGDLPRYCRIASCFVVILCSLAVIYSAWMQIGTARFSRFLTLGWPKWIVSAGLLASMALIILVQLREIVLHCRGETAGGGAP